MLWHQDFINPSCKELEMVAFWCQTIILGCTTFSGLRTTLGFLNITTGTILPGVMGGEKGKLTFFAFHLSFIFIQLKCHYTSNCVFYNFPHPLKKKEASKIFGVLGRMAFSPGIVCRVATVVPAQKNTLCTETLFVLFSSSNLQTFFPISSRVWDWSQM